MARTAQRLRLSLLHTIISISIITSSSSSSSSSEAAACGSPSGGAAPHDAPTATLYGAGAYAWADALVRWDCVYSIADYPGSTNDAFDAAQADAVANGGGVVFFPAGSYTVSRNLSIASNIVIRGAATTASAKNGRRPGPLAPASILACPNRRHMGVWSMAPNATNIGVVNLYLNQCAIMFWPGLVTTHYESMMQSWWWDATDIAGSGSNKLVLSNVVMDVSYGSAAPASASGNPYPWAFSIAIGVYTDRNALIGNNLLPASTRNEMTNITLKNSSGKLQNFSVPYPYDNRYGIDVNSILLGAVAGHYASGPASPCKTPSAFGGLYPACAPFNYRRGIVIRDNYVANNGRVGISFTGGNDTSLCAPGSGTLVMNNHVQVRPNTTALTVDGTNVGRGSDTNENRGYMKQGYCSNITHNSGEIHRQIVGLGVLLVLCWLNCIDLDKVASPLRHMPVHDVEVCVYLTLRHAPTPGLFFTSGPYETVDGEGILMQSENGGNAYGDIIVGNDLSGGSSGYIANWDLAVSHEGSIMPMVLRREKGIHIYLVLSYM